MHHERWSEGESIATNAGWVLAQPMGVALVHVARGALSHPKLPLNERSFELGVHDDSP
ncbi:MAG: hypothetical protein U0269_27480 [Polyangiales bacterium]